ncbi:MAG: hypothetical protein NZ651_05945 [Candidatus Bipolaricaulota bacterium]|nr:hypothetical protein [Candidatus Bipolaricaulota bacterium]MDW8127295.1 hypothetical protein [Candidatus Bipolaricaulota bacterium]
MSRAWLCALGLGWTLFGLAQTPGGLPPGAVDRLGWGVPTDLALSPNGRFLALGTSIGVEIRDPKSLELHVLLAPHRAWAKRLAFAPDGETLAVAFVGGAVTLWKVEGWEEQRTLTFPEAVEGLAWSPQGETLAIAAGRKVYGVDPVQGRREIVWESPAKKLTDLAFSPGGALVVLAENELWFLEFPRGEVRWKRRFAGELASPAFLPTGELVLGGGQVLILDPETEAEIGGRAGLALRKTALQGTRLAGALGPSLVLLDLSRHTEEWIPTAHGEEVIGLALFQDSLFSVGRDGALKVWDVRTKTLLRSWEEVRSPVYALALSPAGTLLATGSSWTVHLWDLPTRGVRSLVGRFELVVALGLGEDFLVVGEREGLRTLDLATGITRTALSGVRGSLPWPWGFQLLVVSACGQFVAGFCGDLPRPGAPPSCPVCVWRGHDLQLLRTWKVEDCPWLPRSLALSTESGLLAVGTPNRVEVWDLQGASRRAVLPLEKCMPVLLAISPAGRFLAVGLGSFEDAECLGWQIWDLERAARVGMWDEEQVTALAFAPQEDRLAYGTESGAVVLVDLTQAGFPRRTLRGHTAAVLGLLFSPDGTRLYSGSLDGTVLVWETPASQSSSPTPGLGRLWLGLIRSSVEATEKPLG